MNAGARSIPVQIITIVYEMMMMRSNVTVKIGKTAAHAINPKSPNGLMPCKSHPSWLADHFSLTWNADA
jgi:hypothetical protein